MGNVVWSSAGDTDGNTAANWNPARVPTAGDTAYYDATSVVNCTFSGALSCDAINVTAAYSGDIDFNDQTITTTGDQTYDGTAELKCGTGTITCGGNFDNQHQGTWTRETSTLVMTGAAKTITSGSTKDLHHFQSSGTITVAAATTTRFDVQGNLTVDNTKSLTCDESCLVYGNITNAGTITISAGKQLYHYTGTISNTGTITGDGTLKCETSIITPGTLTPATILVQRGGTLNAGSYGAAGGTVLVECDSLDRTVTVGGSLTFPGDVTFDADVATKTLEIDWQGNDVEFQGDVSITKTAGVTVTWTNPGSTTFSKAAGTQTYTDSVGVQIGNVYHDGAGELELATEMACATFDGDAGTFDPNEQTVDCSGNVDWDNGWDFIADADAMNGCTWIVGGNFTAENQTCNATAEWFLQVTGTAVASGTGAVAHSNANGVNTEIDASAGPWTDNDNNTNWNFGAPGFGGVNQIIGGGVIAA